MLYPLFSPITNNKSKTHLAASRSMLQGPLKASSKLASPHWREKIAYNRVWMLSCHHLSLSNLQCSLESWYLILSLERKCHWLMKGVPPLFFVNHANNRLDDLSCLQICETYLEPCEISHDIPPNVLLCGTSFFYGLYPCFLQK